MSKLTDKISYLQGLAEGMKLNPEKDSNRLILGILEVLGEMGESFDALAEAHGELSDYVESIDNDLSDLLASLEESGAEVILIERHAPQNFVGALEEAGYAVARLDTLMTHAADSDMEAYERAMLSSAEEIARAMKQNPAARH